MYLELAGDSGLYEHLGATMRSMVCCSWWSDDAFSTGAFGQVCIAVSRVLLGRLSQGQDRCPSLQFHTGGRGVRLPPGPPFGARLFRALRDLYDLAGACSEARTAPCPSIAPALTACCFSAITRGGWTQGCAEARGETWWIPFIFRWNKGLIRYT